MTRRLSKKHDANRQFRSLKTHAAMLLTPTMYAVAAVSFWLTTFWRWHGQVPHLDRDIILVGVLFAIGMPFSIFAAGVYNDVAAHFSRMMQIPFQIQGDLHGARREFLKLRDERLPNATHLVLGIFGMVITSVLFLVDYSERWLGILSIFIVVFCYAIYWQVILYLEDPTESAWLKERIPEEWLTADVDHEFGLDLSLNGNGHKSDTSSGPETTGN